MVNGLQDASSVTKHNNGSCPQKTWSSRALDQAGCRPTSFSTRKKPGSHSLWLQICTALSLVQPLCLKALDLKWGVGWGVEVWWCKKVFWLSNNTVRAEKIPFSWSLSELQRAACSSEKASQINTPHTHTHKPSMYLPTTLAAKMPGQRFTWTRTDKLCRSICYNRRDVLKTQSYF